jgi:hypothetical protein
LLGLRPGILRHFMRLAPPSFARGWVEANGDMDDLISAFTR